MNVYDYCETVTVELGNWKKKLTLLDNKIATLPCGSKDKMHDNIEELHMVIAEMEDRLYNLEHACPISWRPASDERVGPVTINYEEAAREKVDYDFGG
ncbi:MAG: hypothetical protein C4531_03685 [Desulfurivibrio sp.]|jgi:hypothetical protein|nr:MAG: hypothetical protein C4531_03685 [Desulfurivibrio sp.]